MYFKLRTLIPLFGWMTLAMLVASQETHPDLNYCFTKKEKPPSNHIDCKLEVLEIESTKFTVEGVLQKLNITDELGWEIIYLQCSSSFPIGWLNHSKPIGLDSDADGVRQFRLPKNNSVFARGIAVPRRGRNSTLELQCGKLISNFHAFTIVSITMLVLTISFMIILGLWLKFGKGGEQEKSTQEDWKFQDCKQMIVGDTIIIRDSLSGGQELVSKL